MEIKVVVVVMGEGGGGIVDRGAKESNDRE